MGSNGVSEVSAVADERVGAMVNGTSLTCGSIAGLGACGDYSLVGVKTHVNNELAEVGEFLEGDRGGLVRRSWVDGSEERIWKPSLRIHLRC